MRTNFQTDMNISYPQYNVYAEISEFRPKGKTAEIYALFHVEAAEGELFESQIEKIDKAKRKFADSLGDKVSIVFERYLLSDIANQVKATEKYANAVTAVSHIKQEPLDGSKVALLTYFTIGTSVKREGNTTIVESNGYTHLWTTDMMTEEGDSYLQTHKLLFEYEDILKQHDANLAGNCIRTWFFVRDVDSNYAGLVKGRKEHFDHIGLTPQTHYISSTGIDGSPAKGQAKVQFEAVTVKGLKDEQIKYLQALSHLNPTYEYGVTFERGTKVTYGDRAHVWISGTASIDNKGQILHEGNVTKQALRMWENVEMLLKEGDATFDDVAYMIVYLRDVADYATVKSLYNKRFPNKPKVFVHAPVCRPGWLIEMECVAIVPAGDSRFPNF